MATVIRGDDNFDTALKAGQVAFAAKFLADGWSTISSNVKIPFSNDSDGDSFDTDGAFNTTTSLYTAPTTGLYTFWASIYTGGGSGTNAFAFYINGTQADLSNSAARWAYSEQSTEKTYNFSATLQLSANDTVGVYATQSSRFYTGFSSFGGYRVK